MARGGTRLLASARLDELRAGIAEEGEELLHALDRHGPALVAGWGRRRRALIREHLTELLGLTYKGHPWAALVVASSEAGVRPRSTVAAKLARSAWRAFRLRGDEQAQGYAAHVLGNIALGRGDLPDAGRWWSSARDLLGEGVPAQELSLANLALDAYQRGDLSGGLILAQEALALAALHRNRLVEGLALTYFGFLSLNAGDMARADSALTRALRILDEIPNPSDRSVQPLAHTALGVLHALRDDVDAAERAFEAAITCAREVNVPWLAAFAKASRAEFLVAVDPQRAMRDAESAKRAFAGQDDGWWRSWTIRSDAIARRAVGEIEQSRSLLEGLLSEPLYPLERARALLSLGMTRLAADDPAAADAFEEAAALARAHGARYVEARALVSLGEVDRVRAAELHARATRMTDGDPAWRHLLRPSGRLRINLGEEPAVYIADSRATFKTVRAELLVYALALAAPSRMHSEELVELLWPDTGGRGTPRRLRTALWDARRALGVEGWRIDRHGDALGADMDGAVLDIGVVPPHERGDILDELPRRLRRRAARD